MLFGFISKVTDRCSRSNAFIFAGSHFSCRHILKNKFHHGFCFTGFHSRLYITCQCLNIQHLNLIALKLCLRLAAWYKWQTVRFRRSEMNRLCMKRPLESGKSCPGSAVVLWPSQAGVRFCRPFPAFNKRYSVAGPSLASGSVKSDHGSTRLL